MILFIIVINHINGLMKKEQSLRLISPENAAPICDCDFFSVHTQPEEKGLVHWNRSIIVEFFWQDFDQHLRISSPKESPSPL